MGRLLREDFFWRGINTFCGNSQTSNDSGNSDKDSEVYHIEDYVTYKKSERNKLLLENTSRKINFNVERGEKTWWNPKVLKRKAL